MIYPLLFLSGVIASVTSAAIGIKEDNDRDILYEAEKAAKYNDLVQSRYDGNIVKLYSAYYIDDMIKEIQRDYPQMNDYCANLIAEASIAKKLMEEETEYKYKPSERCKYFNLDKYTKEEYKKEKGKEWWE